MGFGGLRERHSVIDLRRIVAGATAAPAAAAAPGFRGVQLGPDKSRRLCSVVLPSKTLMLSDILHAVDYGHSAHAQLLLNPWAVVRGNGGTVQSVRMSGVTRLGPR